MHQRKEEDGEARKIQKILEELKRIEEHKHDKNEDEAEQKEKICDESKQKMLGKFAEFTTSQIQDAIDSLKRGKAGDNSGIRAE